MKTKTPKTSTTLAATIAAEDLRVGMFVAILSETYEFPSFLWDCAGSVLSPHELVRLQSLGGAIDHPLRVENICLPFVFVQDAQGQFRTLDIRRTQLARLEKGYARDVRKALRRQHEAQGGKECRACAPRV